MSGIDVERSESGVVTIWLDNPRRLNALSDAMILGLCEAMPHLAQDATCRVIVLRGRGGVFCAGRDLGDLKALQSAGPESAARMYHAMRQMNEAIYFSPHPVVSVIERYAFGIATMLASWSDIALADEGAQFGYPEVQHGITPYGAVPTMLNTMTQKAMLDLLLTGRRIGAAEAVHLGIITRAVAADRLDAERDLVFGDLFRGSAVAIRRSKQFVRECEALSYREALAAATDKHIAGIGTPEMREGVAAFLDKRKADWS
ncbi:MAG TPA: enoyl-CoA hydratase/isomerase family protein [Casimicrobiaceae bacterium]|nr:enoyl-CoA hydratase/isomerase family protein [Casimicrobiaceae bacterium]